MRLAGIRSRSIDGVNGLQMHILEAGHEPPGRPCLLLLHGFPEIAYSWRKVMLPLATAGFHVVAPDQRGYGRTAGGPASYGADLAPFRILNLVTDMVALLSALGHPTAAVIGHDYGASVAAACALVRPDLFRSLVLMSAPFTGPPALPFDPTKTPATDPIHAALARLDPPRKHYHQYYATPHANADMWHCAQGVHAFLRGYFHHKSADWPGNRPFPLQSWTAGELAKMPTYYIMELDLDMAQTSAAAMPSAAEIAGCAWLPEDELAVYSAEYERTGFQGGLQGYRCRMNGSMAADLALLSGRTIDVPSMFVAGSSDWGAEQVPGGIARMRDVACTRMVACHQVDGAGHWVQQEQPEQVTRLLLEFILGPGKRS